MVQLASQALPLAVPPKTSVSKIRRRRSEGIGSAGASTAFLLPIIAVFVVLFAVPLAQTVYYSFTDYTGLSPEMSFVGLENYQRILTDPSLLMGLGFTLFFTVASTLLITATAIPLAVVLNKKFMGSTLARSVIFFVGIPSQVILGLVWQYIFSPLKSGALNAILAKVGIGPIPWLADSTLAQLCVIFVGVWAGVGWHAMLYIAYLQSIPEELYEQAQIDGANGRQQFFAITLPQLIPAIIISSFLLVTAGLKIFDLPFAMTKGGPGYATNTITQSIIIRGLAQSDYGIGSALAVLFTVASVAIIMTQLGTANAIARKYS